MLKYIFNHLKFTNQKSQEANDALVILALASTKTVDESKAITVDAARLARGLLIFGKGNW